MATLESLPSRMNGRSAPAACIAIDLTPMRPGGTSGGAKVLTLDLVRRIRQRAPHLRLILLTNGATDREVADICGPDVERIEVTPNGSVASSAERDLGDEGLLHRLRQSTFGRAGAAALRRLFVRTPVAPPHVAPALRDRGADLLFCPFTAPLHVEPGLRTVCILYDLQHVAYPQFFAPEEIAGRNAHLELLRRWSDAVVCISEHSRRTLVEQIAFPAERTCTIPIAIHDRLTTTGVETVRQVRARYGIGRDYALYPANGWPHKNHRLLLAAFRILRARRPEVDIDLVLTGSMHDEQLQTFAHRLGLGDRVHWIGHCDSTELSALYQDCRMVVFPSLYEGFGIPLLEAMWFAKPVACSNATSLPEVGGNAVRYFDPRRPEDIAAAMEDVLTSAGLARELVTRGRERLDRFDSDAMADAYVDVFERVMRMPPTARDAVTGVFADGWTSNVLRVAFAGGPGRTLKIDVEVPAWRPRGGVEIAVDSGKGNGGLRWRVRPGRGTVLDVPLPPVPGDLSISFTPAFRPSEHGMGDDTRVLGCRCRSVRIVEEGRPGSDLLAGSTQP